MPTTTPPFERMVRLYREAITKMYGPRALAELLEHPEASADPRFQAAAEHVAKAMAREVSVASAASWRQAAFKSTRAREVFESLRTETRKQRMAATLRAIAERNASLISSVPQEIADRITKRAMELRLQGARPAEIAKEIRKWAPQLVKSRIKLISRTEIHKSFSQLTQARSQNLGLDWAIWSTSDDSRVRPSHKNLDNVLMNWSDPPQPEALIGERSTLGAGFGGEFPNCRCTMLPMVDLSEIKWPAKVFAHGKITRMSRAQFHQAAGLTLAA